MSEKYLYDLSILPEWPLSEQAAERDRYRKALEWYARQEIYGGECAVLNDAGGIARTALEVK